MKKKILIASLFATIMLLVPFSSSTGVSIGELNTKGEVIAEPYPVYCALLWVLFINFNDLYIYYYELAQETYTSNPSLSEFYLGISMFYMFLAVYFLGYGAELGCWEISDELESETGLNLQLALNSISTYDTTTITELIQSYELNGCPCMQ